MKVIKITPVPTFNPITLEIVIESQEEFDALRNMATMIISIPKLVSGDVVQARVSDTQKHVASFLTGLHQTLTSQK